MPSNHLLLCISNNLLYVYGHKQISKMFLLLFISVETAEGAQRRYILPLANQKAFPAEIQSLIHRQIQ